MVHTEYWLTDLMTGWIAVEFSSLTLFHLQVRWGNGGIDQVWGGERAFSMTIS